MRSINNKRHVVKCSILSMHVVISLKKKAVSMTCVRCLAGVIFIKRQTQIQKYVDYLQKLTQSNNLTKEIN